MGFHVPINDCETTVAVARTAGSPTIIVASGTGALWGNPSVNAPVIASVKRVTGTAPNQVTVPVAIFNVIGVSGDTLTVSGTIEGTTDQNLFVGDDIANRVTAGSLLELQQAITTINQGPQGSQGFQGVTGSGSQGAQGRQGSVGGSGVQGLQGSTGTGSQGFQGVQGSTGVTGSQGLRGSQGSVGAQGGAGSQGSTGGAGSQGLQGSTGNQGATGISGQQGRQGVTGQQGVPGYQGGSGATGSTGQQGNQGVSGPQGRQGFGPQGLTGATGATGNAGVQGWQGRQGVTGYQGLTGSTGATGNQGLQGATGSTGTQGLQGSVGVTGNQGLQGLTGAGSQGNQGLQGATGVQGNQGRQGATGAGTQGFQGNQGVSATGTQGNQGFQGSLGTQGNQGLTGAGAQGVQGFQGAQGRQGQIGSAGAIGSQGFQGSTGGAGSQGFQGTTGVQGNQGVGTQGFQGFIGATGIPGSQGVQGLQGLTGAGTQGNQGFQGFQGTTGVQGTQGVGAQGFQGVQGFQGTTGATGNQGFQGLTGTQGEPGGFTLAFQFSATTTFPAPSGFIRFNNSTLSSVTQVNVSDTDSNSANVGNVLDVFVAGTVLQVFESGSYIYFRVTGATDNGTNTTFNVSYLTSAGGFSDGDHVSIGAGVTGSGSQGFQGVQGALGTQGFQGVAGSGAQGVQGVQGNQGRQGSTGTGSQGSQGFQGTGGGIGSTGNTFVPFNNSGTFASTNVSFASNTPTVTQTSGAIGAIFQASSGSVDDLCQFLGQSSSKNTWMDGNANLHSVHTSTGIQTITAGSGNLSGTAGDLILISFTSSAPTYTLPDPGDFGTGIFVVQDIGGTAATKNITLNPFGPSNINGSGSAVKITSNYGSLIFFTDGSDYYMFTATSSTPPYAGGPFAGNYVETASNYTAATTDTAILGVGLTGDITVTLNCTALQGTPVNVHNGSNAHTVTIALSNSSKTLNGTTNGTFSIASQNGVLARCDSSGNYWFN